MFWFPEPAFSSGVELFSRRRNSDEGLFRGKNHSGLFQIYRNKIGLDVAVEALRPYKERTKRSNRKMVLRYAEMNRVQRIARPLPGGNSVSNRHLAASVRQRLLNQC